ncbi:hypothetical protein N7509_010896 [Penicillium cosmopolitanum]|uniref:GPI anchored protein n=1 Tax=Penicillium cosmopolitanum TaxID=1131564 RepID=A0A9X0B514_9EURO|nr:uncharacterized protein N7509_010896 [Penicillium cosmopolitanum]KAJ5388355.1 hypothetical protein N7509_010896 [Penicillium cosmopolitanum]
MQTKVVVSLLLASLAAAAPQATGSSDSDINIPASIQGELFSALPTSVQSELLADPTGALPSIYSEYATKTEWISSLPSDVQSWISGAESSISDNSDSTTLTGSSSGTATDSTTGSSSVVATTTVESTAKTTSSETGSSTAASSSDGASSSAGSETSTAGAPAATGMGMGLAGAAGVLGVALFL